MTAWSRGGSRPSPLPSSVLVLGSPGFLPVLTRGGKDSLLPDPAAASAQASGGLSALPVLRPRPCSERGAGRSEDREPAGRPGAPRAPVVQRARAGRGGAIRLPFWVRGTQRLGFGHGLSSTSRGFGDSEAGTVEQKAKAPPSAQRSPSVLWSKRFCVFCLAQLVNELECY